MAFRPSYMATLQSGHDAAGKAVRRVLLGRGDTPHTPNFDLFYHPLLIDPEKQSVEVVRQKLETPKDLRRPRWRDLFAGAFDRGVRRRNDPQVDDLPGIHQSEVTLSLYKILGFPSHLVQSSLTSNGEMVGELGGAHEARYRGGSGIRRDRSGFQP